MDVNTIGNAAAGGRRRPGPDGSHPMALSNEGSIPAQRRSCATRALSKPARSQIGHAGDDGGEHRPNDHRADNHRGAGNR